MSDAAAVFRQRFRRDEFRIARAPGRVNLIGEHTDYNDGFVLPLAIDRYVTLVFAPRDDAVVRGYSIDFREERSASVDDLTPCTGPPTWFDYAAGVAWVLHDEDVAVRGLDFVVSGDVPMGAGLSSSAAIELAIARALFDVSGLSWDGRRGARTGQRVENDFIGLASGVMDQMASAMSREGTAMLLDCRDTSIEHVPIPESLAVVVMDTGTRRSVAESAYNDRRASCERVVEVIHEHHPNVSALRDVDERALGRHRNELDATDYARALHVVRENQRTLDMADALRRSDVAAMARLMEQSHESLRTLYAVSCPELDAIASMGRDHPACRGARMTGAGFGGCAVALVEIERAGAFAKEVRARYRAGELYVCRAVSGARIVD